MSDKKLFAYGQKQPLEVIRTFVADMVYEANVVECVDKFTVIKGTGRPLLGRKTAEKLNVLGVGPESVPNICFVVEVGCDQDIRENYTNILTEVEKLKEYGLKLHVNKEVKPEAQQVRRLSSRLRVKVNLKLGDLRSKEIIEDVTGKHTNVMDITTRGIPKVCVDMRRANEAIIRERHPIPTIDLNGSTVFSKLDLKSEFHQVELEEESREVTTFVTHRGHIGKSDSCSGFLQPPRNTRKSYPMFSTWLQGSGKHTVERHNYSSFSNMARNFLPRFAH